MEFARRHLSYYDLLGVRRDADVRQIRRAYRNACRQWHPDKNAAPEATQRFQQVREAYDVLSNALSRIQYDLALDIEELGLAFNKPEPPVADSGDFQDSSLDASGGGYSSGGNRRAPSPAYATPAGVESAASSSMSSSQSYSYEPNDAAGSQQRGPHQRQHQHHAQFVPLSRVNQTTGAAATAATVAVPAAAQEEQAPPQHHQPPRTQRQQQPQDGHQQDSPQQQQPPPQPASPPHHPGLPTLQINSPEQQEPSRARSAQSMSSMERHRRSHEEAAALQAEIHKLNACVCEFECERLCV
jgi:curved DNA-binding protein CbpA